MSYLSDFFLWSAEAQLALVSDLLVKLLGITPHSLLFLQLLKQQGLLVAIDDLIQFVPNESLTRLSIATYSTKQLHVSSFTLG